jgi:energy-coupling factor transport system substrate-specific component
MVIYLFTAVIACIVLTRFERDTSSISILAQLLALAVIGRWLFVAIPNVQPTTALLIFAALYFGWTNAAVLSLFVPILSGLLLGLGPFVLYQFLGWLFVITIATFLRPVLKRSIFILSLFGLTCGFLFGWITNLSFAEVIGVDFIKLLILSFPFDLAHGIGNVFFLILLKTLFIRIFVKQQG